MRATRENPAFAASVAYGTDDVSSRTRLQIEAEIEERIALLDLIDGDPDLEPSLGWSKT